MSIVELRQYTLRPGMRETLVALFEREFLEPQEAVGMTLVGQFEDARDPDRFVWVRRFENMTTRVAGLRAFYGGSVWKTHRDAANATMIDSDDVLLLRPAQPASDLPLLDRPHQGSASSTVFVSTAYMLERPAEDGFVDVFERDVRPALEAAGADIMGYFVSERSANDFPALPVREGLNAFVWIERFADEAAYRAFLSALGRSTAWRDVAESVARDLVAPIETRVLRPTPRSRLR